MIAQTGSRSRLVTMPLPADDPTQRKPDTSLAQAQLEGWAPTVELEEGLRRTIAYFAQKLGLESSNVSNEWFVSLAQSDRAAIQIDNCGSPIISPTRATGWAPLSKL